MHRAPRRSHRLAWRSAALVGVVAVAAACSGGGTTPTSDGAGAPAAASGVDACALLERLAGTGSAVATADVGDPEAFEQRLTAAVDESVAVLDELHDAVPDALVPVVEELAGLTEQHRFAEALDTRAELDAWADEACESR